MTFARIKAAGWAVGETLTSAQQTSLDIDHANALDKSAAGDSLLGIVQVSAVGSEIVAGIAGAITATVATGITTTASGGISSQNASGGITLAGGTNDWVTFFPTRNRGFNQHMIVVGAIPANWGSNGIDPLGTASATPLIIPLQVHNGAQLLSVTVSLVVAGPHSSLPLTLPSLQVKRAAYTIGGPVVISDLSTTALQGPTPANAAAWDNGGNLQTFAYNCNQNNTIATGSNKYYVILIDENGANSVTGNRYVSIAPIFTNIASLQFP